MNDHDSSLAPRSSSPVDQTVEVQHAWHHFWENLWSFVAFFGLILLAVANYEFSESNNYWFILILGAARAGMIFFFISTLIRPFNFVLTTIVFTVGFFCWMVGLSVWAWADPIMLPKHHS